jgi:hypothetical protein
MMNLIKQLLLMRHALSYYEQTALLQLTVAALVAKLRVDLTAVRDRTRRVDTAARRSAREFIIIRLKRRKRETRTFSLAILFLDPLSSPACCSMTTTTTEPTAGEIDKAAAVEQTVAQLNEIQDQVAANAPLIAPRGDLMALAPEYESNIKPGFLKGIADLAQVHVFF